MKLRVALVILVAALAGLASACVVDTADYGLAWGRYDCVVSGSTVTCMPL